MLVWLFENKTKETLSYHVDAVEIVKIGEDVAQSLVAKPW